MNFQSAKSFGKLRLRTFQTYHQIVYMLTLSTLGISISNAFNAIYVDTLNTKHINTFLPITFLIFNGFSIRKKFWKAETQGFSTILSMLYMSTLSTLGISISNAFNAIYVDTVDTKHINTFLPITFLIFNGFSIRKKFWKAETQGFSTIKSMLYMLTLLTLGISISNAFNAIYVDTVDTKHINTFLPITFLIFNGFSIHKKFGKLRLRAF